MDGTPPQQDELHRSGEGDTEMEADELCEDWQCPNCLYCLRGLSGEPICCPECGRESTREALREFAADLASDELNPVDRSFQTALSYVVGGALLIALGLALFSQEHVGYVLTPLGVVVSYVGWRKYVALSNRKEGYRSVLVRFVVVAMVWIAGFLSAIAGLYHIWGWFVKMLSDALSGSPVVREAATIVFGLLACALGLAIFLVVGLGIAHAIERVQEFCKKT